MKLLRPTGFHHKVAISMAVLLLFQTVFPVAALALTSGPTQPEFNEFEPVGTTQMVDLFSGDFTYNIPLFELPGPDGGYPFNLSYHSGITMDQEASWVGLGWSMNHGAITRTMRGLPDDFDGDEVERKMDMRENKTWQVGLNAHVELVAAKLKKPKAGKVGLGLGLRVMYNSYRGFGLAFNVSPNASFTKGATSKGTFGGGASLGVSSFDGASFQPSLSIGSKQDELGALNLSLNINSRQGAQSLSLGYAKGNATKNKKGEVTGYSSEGGGSSTFSFNKATFTPQVSMPYRGTNKAGSLQGGGYVPPFLSVGGSVNVSLNKQTLQYRNIFRPQKAYGFFNSKTISGTDNSLLDFNREKDGVVHETTSNLSTPISTPDVYSVMGQGTGGSYRAYRSDVGIFTDPYQLSRSNGGSFGFEINGGSGIDLGGDLGWNSSTSTSGNWSVRGNLQNFNFKSGASTSSYEPFYFKSAGEKTAESVDKYNYIGNEHAVRLQLDEDDRSEYAPISKIENLSKDLETTIGQGTRTDRKPRATSIQPISNDQLLINGSESLNEYKIKYYDQGEAYTSGNLNDFSREDHIGSHTAGITDLQPNGMRYVYGLPVLNKTQEDIVFSIAPGDINEPTNANYDPSISDFHKVDKTDQYLDHTKVPQYVHTHLLTSVLGADYVDLGEPGPSDEDYGYWVKFNYVKTSDNFKWRTPFAGANYLKGHLSDDSDDKGAIMYGEREQYYLATAETKTHIAEFEILPREDGRGASNVFQTTPTVGAESYKLARIKLYSKLERLNNDGSTNENAIPIKSVMFNDGYAEVDDSGNAIDRSQDYDLCKGTLNNGTTNGGKLTLNKLHFEYQNSQRGRLSPYKFNYDLNSEVYTNNSNNPSYNDFNYDRWGTYGVKTGANFDHPYTKQDDGLNDLNAAAWHLHKIQLPSGSTIKVDYESDDYAYVQDREAMQMFKLENSGDNCLNINTNSMEGINNHPRDPLSEEELKVYFELEPDITDINKYVGDIHNATFDESGEINGGQIFFKIKVNLKEPASNCLSSKNTSEYVSGYANIDEAGIAGNEGYIKLKPVVVDGRAFHPFAVTAWHYLKLNFPSKIATDNNDLNSVSDDGIKEAIKQFAAAFGEIKNIFKSYYKYCSQNQFGSEIDVNNSFIRLNTPDKIKKGGGSRVKQVTLQDNWDVDGDGIIIDENIADATVFDDVQTYGQVYDYTTLEDGEIISSGVASNEPAVGYEECALRYAKVWSNESYLKTDKNVFFEYPINEGYLPGASVGYSEVKVKSLATHLSDSGTTDGLPVGFGTTGITNNKFYTAKDFPITVEETLLDKWVSPIRVVPLLIANFTFDKYTGTQGYAVTFNDMHGKPKEVTHYEKYDYEDDPDIEGLKLVASPELSKVLYTYQTKEKVARTISGKLHKINVLDNKVDVLYEDGDLNADIRENILGVDYDFFVDMRETESNSREFALGLNGDYTPPFFFLPGGAPLANTNESRTRTAVMNKIIRKSGILIKTDAYDGQSLVTTSNKVFDPLGGEPLLTTVNNSFVDPSLSNPPVESFDKIYNYNIPARLAYERMGAAYENWGTKFRAVLHADASCGLFTMLNSNVDLSQVLVPGDECLITGLAEGQSCDDYGELCANPKFTFVGTNEQGSGTNFLFENTGLASGYAGAVVDVMIIRSGNRNHLSAKSGSITALSNPTIGREVFTDQTSIPDISLNNRKIDNVLNASAVTYRDFWDLERFVTTETETIVVSTTTPVTCNKHYIVSSAPVNFEQNSVRVNFQSPHDCPEDGVAPDCSFEYAFRTNGGFGSPSGPGQSSGFPFAEEFLCTTDENLNGDQPFPISISVARTSNNGNPEVYNFPPLTFPMEIEVDVYYGSTSSTQNVNFNYMTSAVSCNTEGCVGGGSNTTTTTVDRSVTKYEYGEKGIWRPFQNYTYVTPRNSTIDETDSSVAPDLSNDGTFNDFTLFDWENPFFKYSTGADNWKETNRITKYAANGEEVENRDIIGLHSSALYAYKDNLPIAVAANASHYEIAFEGFETLEEEGTKGNLDFLCGNSQNNQIRYISNTYEVFGKYEGGNQLNIDKLVESGNLLTPGNTYALLVLEDENGNEYEATASVDAIIPSGLNNEFNKQVSSLTLTNLDFGCNPLPTGTVTTGRVIVKQEKEVVATNNTSCDNNNVTLSSNWSHSGEKSLMMDGVSGSNFNQGSTELQPGKTYVISAWVSLGENFDGHTLEDKIQIAYDPETGDGDFVSFRPSGPMINGWQRVEGTFVAENITEPDGFWTIGFDIIGDAEDMNLPAYFDDVRIYPLDGNIQTYVYNPLNYRLSAVLDNNNFATFYHYDEEGNLFLVKKETAEGIKTIQETREYVKVTN